MSKFASKKGQLVVDLGSIDPRAPKPPKMAVVGSKPSKVSEKKILEKFDAPAPTKGKKDKKEKAAKGKKTAEPKAPRERENAKIKVLNKNHGAREGSKRAAKWDALVSSKTLAEAYGKEDLLDSGSVAAAVAAGVISLS